MRKLATAAFAFAAALSAANWLIPAGNALLIAAACCLALGAAAFLLTGDARLRALIICVSAAVGFAWYWGYREINAAPAEALDGRTMTVTAAVTDYPEERGGFCVIYLRLTDDAAPRTLTAVYDFSGETPRLAPGDIVTAELSFESALVKYGEETDRYSSRGIFLTATPTSGYEITGRSELSFLYFPKRLARYVSEAVDIIFSEDTRALMKALLIGDDSGLYDNDGLNSALSLSGIRHIAAVSGMHLSFLYGFLRLLLGKRRAAYVGIPVIAVFVLMAGCSPSAVRAAVMLALFTAAPLLGRETDGLTSLAAPLLLLLVINPLAVASVSLQFSFAAVLGMTLVMPKMFSWLSDFIPKAKKRWLRTLRGFILASFVSSVGALIFTLPLTALYYGRVSLVSPIMNLLTLWAVSASFIAGYAAVILAAIAQWLGVAAAWVAALGAKYVILIAETASSLPAAAIYTSDRLVIYWLVFAYGIFIYAYLRRGKERFRPLIPAAVCAVTLCAVLLTEPAATASGCSVTVLDVGQGQCVAALTPDETWVFDCGGGGTWESAGDTLADWLLANGRDKVDVLVLTHLHSDHAGGVTRLMSRMEVGLLIMPLDGDDSDDLRGRVLDAADQNGAEVRFISGEDAVLRSEYAVLTLFAPLEAGSANESGIIILLSLGSYDALITGDVNSAVERRLVETEDLPDMELLVVGHHGSRYSSCFELLSAIDAETAVISVGWNSYGHPSDEVLSRLALMGMEVYRTDENGNITVRIGENG